MRLLLVIYDLSDPLYITSNTSISGTTPVTNLNNILHLSSFIFAIHGINVNHNTIPKSIAYTYNGFIYADYPIINKKKGEWLTVLKGQLSDMEFQLLDFNLQPIKWMSPIFITVEVRKL
jgi:hypothetical protein